jgi:hypothetical protein
MTPMGNDWFRSLGIFGTAFAAVVVFTMVVAAVIVPSPGGAAPAAGTSPDPARPAPVPTPVGQPTAVGGTLTVSGDREGTLRLTRETTQDRYGLTGDDGRILFAGDPPTIARVQYDGLEFFVDPEDCVVTPGERHDPTGVAGADIVCEAIDDVRGNGVISLEGRVGVAADLFGLRGDLPESGGSVRLGDETLTFDEARLQPSFIGAGYVGRLFDEQQEAALVFTYVSDTHALGIDEVWFGGDTVRIVAGACSTAERGIGLLNPHTRVIELTVDCQRLEIPTLGTVPLEGTIVVELVEPPR